MTSVCSTLLARFVAVLVFVCAGAGSAAAAAEMVAFASGFPAGTVVVHTADRVLYFVLDESRALRYPVGVGRTEWQWTGTTVIDGKYESPNWAPPPEIRRAQPDLPELILGGSPANPMGAAAMTLAGGANAIHGTNDPESIGGFVSYGCIRMFNDDIVDLYQRVDIGTVVVVLP